MSLFDALELLDFLELIRSWRFLLTTVIGVGVGYALFVVLGEGVVGSIIGTVAGFAGAAWGLVWQSRHEHSGR